MCNCQLYTLEEIFYLKMNPNVCPRCGKEFEEEPENDDGYDSERCDAMRKDER